MFGTSVSRYADDCERERIIRVRNFLAPEMFYVTEYTECGA